MQSKKMLIIIKCLTQDNFQSSIRRDSTDGWLRIFLFCNLIIHKYDIINCSECELLLLIISGDNFSMRFLIIFGFCQNNKLHRFRAAEAVLSTIFERSQLIFGKEIGCLIFPKSFPDYKSINNVRTQLIEDIRLSLERLDQSYCSKQVKQQIMGIFEPSKGIYWKYMRASGQQNRFELGINKNSLYAFYLNSGLLSFLIRLLYQRGDNGKFKSVIDYGHRANYLVGTPGLGKSSKLIAIKHLHDLRIPYIISHITQRPKAKIQSKFAVHYKIVYIISDYSLENIQETIEKQLVMDFGYLPSQIQKLGELTHNNCFSYFKGLYNLYRSKGISLKLIIDQVNALYNMLYNKKIQAYQQLMQVFDHMQFFSYPPCILVSSKNNYLYHKNQLDPIIKISQSSQNNIWFRKFILDSYISAEERLISSVECLLFELEKHRVKRNEAIEVIKKVEIGFKTHLNIANVVRQAVLQLKSDTKKQWADILNKLFALSSIDKTSFLANIQNARETILAIEFNPRETEPNKVLLEENILFWINVLLKSLEFTLKVGNAKPISVKISLKCDNVSTKIEKKAWVFRRHNIQNDNFLSQINFFFSYKNYLYFSYSQAELQVLKSELAKHVDIPFLNKLQILNKEVFDRFVQINSGYVFEILVCNFYEQPIRNSFSSFSPISTHIQSIDFEHRITSSKGVVQKFDIQKIVFADMFKKLTMPYNYFRTEVRHKSIDFVLSQYQQGKLKLVLVDTTKSIYDMFIAEKTIKFKANFLSDKHFDSLVNNLCSSQEIKELEIVYYVLMPDQTNNSKLYDSNCIEEVEKNLFDSVENQISVLEVRQHQMQIGLQIQKFKTGQGIIQSSIDNKVAKPAKLQKNQANAKKYQEYIQKMIQQSEPIIKQLETRIDQLEQKAKMCKRSVGAIEKFKENRKVPVKVTVAVGVLNKDFVIKQEIKDQQKTGKDTYGAKIKELMANIQESAKRELSDNQQLN